MSNMISNKTTRIVRDITFFETSRYIGHGKTYKISNSSWNIPLRISWMAVGECVANSINRELDNVE